MLDHYWFRASRFPFDHFTEEYIYLHTYTKHMRLLNSRPFQTLQYSSYDITLACFVGHAVRGLILSTLSFLNDLGQASLALL